MKYQFSMGGMIALIMLAGLPNSASANSSPFSVTFALSGEWDGQINTQPPALHLHSYTLNGTATRTLAGGSRRDFFFNGDIEFQPALATPVHCPATRPLEYPILPGGVIVLADVVTKDLLFLTTGSGGYECDPLDSTLPIFATTHVEGAFTGGIGSYAGSTGDFESDSQGYVLRLDSKGHLFAADKGTIDGTLTMP